MSTFPTPLRVALAGAGMISGYHLRAWSRLANARVVAVVEPDATRAAARCAEFAIPAHYASLAALLERETIDVLDIASPRETHGPLLVSAVERGVAVLCQKPFMPTLREARDLTGWLAGRARVMVNQNFRFRAYYRQMKAWIDEGRLGELTGLAVACRSSGLLRGADGTYPYIERQPFVRGEARLLIEEVLIHRIDIARWLAGPLRLVSAQARRSCPDLRGESEAALLFARIRDGMPVTVDGNLGAAGYPATPASDRVEVIGTRGRIMMDHDVLRLHAERDEEIAYSHPAVYQASFDATVAHFVEALLQGTPFLIPPEDNLETMALCEDAYVASRLAPAQHS